MSSKKRGLGRGLSALIGDKPLLDLMVNDEEKTENDKIYQISIKDIMAKDDQPRRDFDEKSLKDLAKSIEAHGVIQPILLRKKDKKYEIIAGERRFRASKIAKLKTVPSIIVQVEDEDAAKLALIENIQREDLNPIEESIAFKGLMEQFGLKQEELANAIGKSRSYITNSIRLLNLDEKVIQYLYDGKLTTGHGKVLLGIKDKKEQIKLAEKIISIGLNVRETETEVKKTKKIKKKKQINKDPYTIELEEQLMRTFGTKVNLIKGKKTNKIEIEYYGEEDLQRIFDMLID